MINIFKKAQKDKSISKYNHGEKSMKAPFITYADTNSLLLKIDACNSTPENSSAVKINKHKASGYSLFTHSPVHSAKNMHKSYKGE